MTYRSYRSYKTYKAYEAYILIRGGFMLGNSTDAVRRNPCSRRMAVTAI